MNNKVLKNIAGLYFVEGQGFVGTVAQATRLNDESASCTVNCAGKMGISATVEDAPVQKSYAPVYIRKGDSVSLTGVAKNAGNPALNQVDPSKRRFATFKEAAIHAGRFHTRRASRNDAVGSGTAGHVGAFVVTTNDPVNSTVNLATGLTNRLK